MKSISSTATGALVGALVCCFTPAVAMDDHTVKWGPGPASIPKGAQAAAIYGDASKEGLFALRLKLPKGYHIPPHAHPKPEVVTILSGTLRLGEGKCGPEQGQSTACGQFLCDVARYAALRLRG